ncbi:DsbA family protein [Pseudonocardia sp. WMMC193]|uniref:DsbA family protein n=1 Tax=Pseudonocardia sp. WMMC193 TaxID=2911965 RepID=UPI001F29DC45|nr:thioredoxin domain-containing protein [Pseudonocardia sp. WMMC193]MCF7552633.1 DsbA family protein [Pseudonocardia sp. WMMC193]MCF7553747.1 DsbA family protein [Pseudonocardia sp. WMMC193]
MTRNAKISIGVVLVAVVGVLVALLVPWGGADPADSSAGGSGTAGIAARPDSHRLSTAPDGPTFVEFLDFECEACGAVYPVIEQLRAEYGDRVNFVIRYFPIASHFNAERAARAVEAAAQQGQLEGMYKRMYETQLEWGEQQVPMDDRFRGYARDLGLVMDEYDRVYNAPETLDRIRADQADGQALGVQGTPTFFLDGQRLQPQSVGDLTSAFDAALAR